MKKLSLGCALVTFFLAIPCASFAFSLFGPKDYEECQVSAAKEAKNEKALTILLVKCADDFPARRADGGGYQYFDSQTNQVFSVSGPKMSKADWSAVTRARDEVANLARVKRENSIIALSKVDIVSWRIACENAYYCSTKIITATISNTSPFTIGKVYVGWILENRKLDCNAAVPHKANGAIQIRPGGKGTMSWRTSDGPVDGRITGCIGLLAVEVE